MLYYIFKRLLQSIITIWFIATVTFFAMHQIPGDPLLKDKEVNPTIRKNLEEKYGLDKPLFQQYTIFMQNMLMGDFGISFTQENRRVNDIIKEHFPVSALLGTLSLIFATLGGVFFGAWAALFRDRFSDQLIMLCVILSISIPGFVFAILVQLLLVNINDFFGTTLLPVAGWGTVQHLLVPSMILGLGTMAYLIRLMRSTMLEIQSLEYIQTAKAKGMPEHRIFFRHQMPNAFLPILTLLGPTIAGITTGAFVIEEIFTIPGLGRYFIQAVQQQDYTMIMGTTVFYGAFLVFMVLIVDLLYGFIDPRIRVK